MLNFVTWDVAPEIAALFSDSSNLPIRWYGLLFASAFLIGQVIMAHILKVEGRNPRLLDSITVYMVVATVVGARLGHCLFYEPEYFLKHPLEILMLWKGGLASHGATVGILFGIWLYARNKKQSYLGTLDRLVITIALGGAMIRTGNLMNSEILGKPASVPFAFLFVNSASEVVKGNYSEYVQLKSVSQTGKDTLMEGQTYAQVKLNLVFKKRLENAAYASVFINQNLIPGMEQYSESASNFWFPKNPKIEFEKGGSNGPDKAVLYLYAVPRHAAQLYEAVTCIILLALLYALWNKWRLATPEGSLLGIFIIWIFGLRFCYEFLKENQVDFENGMVLNMGQWLSIPLVLAGFGLVYRSFSGKKSG